MFKEKQYVELIGSFSVKEIKEDYIELDPFEKGHLDRTEKYLKDGYQEINQDGSDKEFDGWQVGDFFKLNGSFEVARSNDIFTKVKVGNFLVSIPNHKIIEVE